MIDTFSELRLAIRALLKKPGFTAGVALTLAFGIGATSSIFSVVSAVLLRPLPYHNPDQLVRIWQTLPMQGVTNAPTSAAIFSQWRARNQVFTDVAGLERMPFNLTGKDQPERLVGAKVTPNFWRLLGVGAVLGRTFTEAERDERNVVLSYGFWKRRFASDPMLLGKTLTLNDDTYEVVGVMPSDFSIVPGADVWVPLVFTAEELRQPGLLRTGVIARLRPGVSLAQARQNMAAVTALLGREFPGTEGFETTVNSVRDDLVGEVRTPLLVLFAAVGFVLLVTCANVANLLLARSTERGRETAVRTALGASRMRLVRHSLYEGLLLAAAGGAGGLLLAQWGIRLLISLDPAGIPNLDTIGLDWRVLGLTLVLCLLISLFFGLLPVLHSHWGLLHALREGAAMTMARRGNRLRQLLVIGEVALALVLLIGAGLMIRSFQQLQRVDPGFDPRSVLTLQIALPPERYPQAAQREAFFDEVLAQLQGLPGVRSAAVVTTLPMTGTDIKQSALVESAEVPVYESQAVGLDAVSPDLFRTLGIRLLAGRSFTARDRPEAAPVAIVDEAMARQYWPGGGPLGKRLSVSGMEDKSMTIIGVVASVRRDGLDREAQPHVYVPLPAYCPPNSNLVIRTAADPATFADMARSAVWSIDRDQPLSNVRTLEDIVRSSISQQYFNMRIMQVFALLALLLALVGIHGVLSYWVSQRTREIGIRMALGGKRREVLTLVLGHGLSLVGLGLTLGLGLAFGLTRLIASLLYGVRATDPTTFLLLSVGFGLVSLAACYVPAWRATTVDPVQALRFE